MAVALAADLSKVDPVEAWKPWLPSADEPWDRKRIAHLYRRAAFGATPAEIDRALSDGFPKTLERLLVGEPDAADLLELFTETGQYCKEPRDLRVWWLSAMIEGGHPLREKLTLFWHNHFATSYNKVRSTELMFKQNVLLRKHALGKFRPFLLDVSKDAAILVWLDSNQNLKGAANENYAREVMELFSLGVGNYTEKDVQEAARAFTGWHTNGQVNNEAFEYKPHEHDDGPKTFFRQTGNWNGEDIVRMCCDQPACAKFLVGKLHAFLVSEAPPPKGLLAPLEERFRKSDYAIADLVKTMLGSRLFFSAHSYRKRVKWPVEYAIGAVRAVSPGRVPLGDLVDPLAKMGQVLYAPPNVKGWRTGTDWLNSATLLARNNFAETVALGEWTRPGSGSAPKNAAFSTVTPAARSTDPTPAVPVSEPATSAVAGSAAAAGFVATVPTVDGPDGMKYVLLPGGDVASASAGGPGAPPGPPTTSAAPPPPPEAGVDPIAILYAGKPTDVPSLVKRMGELLYGDRISATQAAKIEKFLLQPGPAPTQVVPPKGPKGPKGPPKESVKEAPRIEPVPGKAPEKVSQKPEEKARGPYKPNFDSAEFMARVREALHAMMCLPEYQLN